MSEQYKPIRRAPREKLKMPLLGNFGSGSDRQGSSESILGTSRFSTLLFVFVGLGLLGQYFLPSLWAEKVYTDYDDLKNLSLDGSLRKKFTDASNPTEIHYILYVREKDGSRKKMDLFKADSVFYDQVAVPQRLIKRAGEMSVRVVRFSKPDTVLRLVIQE